VGHDPTPQQLHPYPLAPPCTHGWVTGGAVGGFAGCVGGGRATSDGVEATSGVQQSAAGSAIRECSLVAPATSDSILPARLPLAPPRQHPAGHTWPI